MLLESVRSCFLLQSSSNAVTTMAFSVRGLVLLGLLELEELQPVVIPTGVPERVEQRGHWRIEHHSDVAVWRCLCGRSDPLVVPLSEMRKVRLPNDLVKACEVCRNELAECSSKSARFKAWLERHRLTIDPQAHLYYPDDTGYAKDAHDGSSTRTRRFVYEVFHKTKLRSDDFVSNKCSDVFCINPHHLCLKKSPAAKLSPAALTYTRRLITKGISTRTIQRLLHEQFSLELSIRSIQLIKSESARSESLVS